jgi:5-methylcytosine-specific restriction endonuclease McrA
MPLILNKKVLVLDKNYRPIRITSVRGAIYLVFREAANVIDNDYNVFTLEEWMRHSKHRNEMRDADFEVLRSVSSVFGIPKIIILKNYIQKRTRSPSCTKMNIFIRDMYECQYCGIKLSQGHATVDHIIPKSKGGEMSWANAATSCKECNNLKGSKTLLQCNMKLLKRPKPLCFDIKFFRYYARRFKKTEWFRFLGVNNGEL